MNEPIIDLQEVLERVQDDQELLSELFDIFTNDYAQKWPILKSAVEKNDFETIRDIAHAIKGAAGNISAKAVHAVAQKIEEAGTQKDTPSIRKDIPLMERHMENLKVRMSQIKKEFQR